MKIYLLLNFLVFIVPFLFSFESRVKYYKKFPELFAAIALTGTLFLSWDAAAVAQGAWHFNPDHLLGWSALGLPLEEFLFFIAVPFSCIFIYEVLCFYLPEREVKLPKGFLLLILGGLTAAAVLSEFSYTRAVLAVCALFFLTAFFLQPAILRSRNYWLFIAVTFVPFLAVNSVLTGLPVVIYDSGAITGARFFSIPIEDFFYSFALLSFNLLIYRYLIERDNRRQSLQKMRRELSSLRQML